MSPRDLHQSVRPSPIFWAIVGVTALGGGLAYWIGDDIGPLAYAGVFIFVIAGWVVSLCLHEFGHAFTAWRFGDRDVALRGYLNTGSAALLSPLCRSLLPIADHRARRDRPARRGGVCPDVVDDHHASAPWSAWPGRRPTWCWRCCCWWRPDLFFDPTHPVLWAGVAFLGFLQLTAVLLNLLPIPGLDGYDALEPHLSPETQRALAPVQAVWLLLLLFLFCSPSR